MYHIYMVITYSKGKDQPGKVDNPARRGQLAEQGKRIFPCTRSRLRIWPRETGSAVPPRVSLLISILRLNLVLTYGIPLEVRGGIHLFIIQVHGVFLPLFWFIITIISIIAINIISLLQYNGGFIPDVILLTLSMLLIHLIQ